MADRKSTSGFVVIVNGAAVSWRAKKQTVVARSTAEAEYVAASDCVAEVIWFRQMFTELGFKLETSTRVYVDNQAALQMTENDVHQSRAKAIDIPFQHIKDSVARGEVTLLKTAGTENPADIFTKPLSPASHYKCVAAIGLE